MDQERVFRDVPRLHRNTKAAKNFQAQTKKRKRLFCRVCGSRVSDMRYLTSVDGGSPNRVFRNPNGDLYEIITLSDCEGLQDTSPPILEETWFPGYPWIVLHCSSCLTHLGWRWENPGRIPSLFYGLIRERLVEKEN